MASAIFFSRFGATFASGSNSSLPQIPHMSWSPGLQPLPCLLEGADSDRLFPSSVRKRLFVSLVGHRPAAQPWQVASRGTCSQRLFVDSHEQRIILIRSVICFIFAAGSAAHPGEFQGMIP